MSSKLENNEGGDNRASSGGMSNHNANGSGNVKNVDECAALEKDSSDDGDDGDRVDNIGEPLGDGDGDDRQKLSSSMQQSDEV